ncbi:hypothetical protein LEP1GSC021_0457 [Leptospira noguchii str. 1993005606]|uniref:Uncharacterized protein n=2 Tax=Leptospira noguchii TaxID=28182 RepID=M6XZU9_9LEPT|nr:hypothetical protein LEP1GSC035_1048 [Leptospira noguchii str. 2007001578]EMO87602.1 hypothetical protein LEP1GSC024_3457 [Leptospira noguchii str. 2001034031]EPE86302.1 hypothetical protein LEP1GSC021_0457 [Leptospira noguchii str. 1993005606]
MLITWISNLASLKIHLEWNQSNKRNPFVIIFLNQELRLFNLKENYLKFIWPN